MAVQNDQPINISLGFLTIILNMSIFFFVGHLEAYLVDQTNHSDRPNMVISISLSLTNQ